MIEPIFEGTRASCWRHPDRKLMPDEKECEECKTIRRNLNLIPPFQVLCTRTHFGVREGSRYTVIWVVRSGAREHNNDMFGYVFKDTGNHLDDHVYDPLAFVPMEFVEKEKKEDDTELLPAGVMIG